MAVKEVPCPVEVGHHNAWSASAPHPGGRGGRAGGERGGLEGRIIRGDGGVGGNLSGL